MGLFFNSNCLKPVQSKGPPVARNWKVAPMINEMFRGETVSGGYTVTGAGFELMVMPE